METFPKAGHDGVFLLAGAAVDMTISVYVRSDVVGDAARATNFAGTVVFACEHDGTPLIAEVKASVFNDESMAAEYLRVQVVVTDPETDSPVSEAARSIVQRLGARYAGYPVEDPKLPSTWHFVVPLPKA